MLYYKYYIINVNSVDSLYTNHYLLYLQLNYDLHNKIKITIIYTV